MNYKETILKFFKDKKNTGIVVILVLGIMLMLFSNLFSEDNIYEKQDEEVYKEDIISEKEEKLKKLILSIDGVEKAEVMICFADTGVKEYYKDETEDSATDKTKTDKKVVFKRYEGNEIPVLKRELYPEVKGVTVIADCTDKNVYDLIFKAVKASLGANSHEIEIIINDRSKK